MSGGSLPLPPPPPAVTPLIMCLPDLKNLTSIPPISIPLSIEKHPILSKLGVFYKSLLKTPNLCNLGSFVCKTGLPVKPLSHHNESDCVRRRTYFSFTTCFLWLLYRRVKADVLHNIMEKNIVRQTNIDVHCKALSSAKSKLLFTRVSQVYTCYMMKKNIVGHLKIGVHYGRILLMLNIVMNGMLILVSQYLQPDYEAGRSLYDGV